MDEATVAGDFGPQARFYAHARPGYPEALIDALLARSGVGPGALVADIGAGTGIASRLLAARGLRVIAIEPSAAMRAQAAPGAGIEWRAGTFEATGLADATLEWAVGAQSFHWAEPRRALPEMRRILKAGRRFTVLWNDRDTAASPLLTETLRIIRAHVPDYEESYRRRDWATELRSTGDFTEVEQLELAHVVRMSTARYLDLWRSHNRLNATAGPERFARLLGEIRRMLAGLGTAELEVPYVCRAWSAR
jgi:SAM-dependent methyltransferase